MSRLGSDKNDWVLGLQNGFKHSSLTGLLDEFALSFHLQSIHFPLTLCSQEAMLRPNTLCMTSSCVQCPSRVWVSAQPRLDDNSESNMLPEVLKKKNKKPESRLAVPLSPNQSLLNRVMTVIQAQLYRALRIETLKVSLLFGYCISYFSICQIS